MIRLFTNLVATFALVLLLITPGVFSANLVQLGKSSGFEIYNNIGKFGKFLKLSEVANSNPPQFNIEFTTFESKPALYRGVLTVENTSDSQKVITIINNNPAIAVFFDTGGTTQGPTELNFLVRQKTEINLLIPYTVQTKSASFNLTSE